MHCLAVYIKWLIDLANKIIYANILIQFQINNYIYYYG